MKKFLNTALILFCSIITFCQVKTGKYFEGVVEYEIKIESHMQGVSDNELREKLGPKLLLHFKNGNYIREYLDGAGYTLNKQYYLHDKNMMYMHNVFFAPDTLYYQDAAEEQLISYKVEQGPTEKILGVECPSSVISGKYVFPYTGDTLTSTLTYYFSPDLPVDPAWWSKMYIWKDVIKEYKSIATKFIEEDPFISKQTYTAVKVTWQPVSDDIFKLDPKLVQVKMSK
ncbi:MAG TPA: hypothetical protein VFI06_12785 [Chitinophagaceae bacterium]|nr:hypothetical protein [Chitinophagaceae bacterium]